MTEEKKKKTVTYVSPAAIPSGIRSSFESPLQDVQEEEEEHGSYDVFLATSNETEAKIIEAYLRNRNIPADADHTVLSNLWRIFVPRDVIAHIDDDAYRVRSEAKHCTLAQRTSVDLPLTTSQVIGRLTIFSALGLFFFMLADLTVPGTSLLAFLLGLMLCSFGFSSLRSTVRKELFQCIRCEEPVKVATERCPGCDCQIIYSSHKVSS